MRRIRSIGHHVSEAKSYKRSRVSRRFRFNTKQTSEICSIFVNDMINVLKPGSIVDAYREDILKALNECECEQVLNCDDEEDIFSISDDDEDDDIPLARLQPC